MCCAVVCYAVICYAVLCYGVIYCSDECQNLLGVKGVVPLLFMLAEYLAKEAGHVIQVGTPTTYITLPINILHPL